MRKRQRRIDMDFQELRYKIEDNKRKIVGLTSLLIALVLIGTGVFMFVRDRVYEETGGSDIVLVEHMIVRNEEDGIDLYSVEENKLVDTVLLPDESVLGINDDLNVIYMLDTEKRSLSELVVQNNTLSFETIKEFTEDEVEKLEDVTEIKASESVVAMKSNESFTLLDLEKESVTTIPIYDEKEESDEEDEDIPLNVTAWNINEKSLFFAKGDNLSRYLLDDSENEHVLEIGDLTTAIYPVNDNMLVYNGFGGGLNKSIALKIDSESGLIEEMVTIEGLNVIKPRVPASENKLVHITVEANQTDGVAKKQLTVKPYDPKMKDNDVKEFVIDLTADGSFDEGNVLSIDGFLYNLEANDLYIGITELRNGREFKKLSIDSVSMETPFFIPVSND